jgi:hypothetical protein
MRQSVYRRWTMAFLLTVCPPLIATASGDPVRVQAGGVSADFGDPASPWRFAGTGFEFEFFVQSAAFSYLGPFADCGANSGGCAVGSQVDLTADFRDFRAVGDSTTSTFMHAGPAVIDGVTYPILYYGGDMTFETGTATAAPGLVNENFSFGGRIAAFTNPSLTGPPVFDWNLTGEGVAEIFLGRTLLPSDAPPNQVSLMAIRYGFESSDPIPEPSTLLLVGSALGGALLRSRRRRGLRNAARSAP